MIKSAFARKAMISVSIITAAFVVTAAPAYADADAYKELTCTSSTGYSIIVQGYAKGYVKHRVDPSSNWDKGYFGTSTFKSTNTHISGNRLAWVTGITLPGGTAGAASNTSKCGTY